MPSAYSTVTLPRDPEDLGGQRIWLKMSFRVEVFLLVTGVTMAMSQIQLQGVDVPPGSRVEVEFEVIPPRTALGSAQQTINQKIPRIASQVTLSRQMAPFQLGMMSPPGAGGFPQSSASQPQTSPQQSKQPTASQQRPSLQNLLTNMAQMALRMRTAMGGRLPLLEEPCPCDADCCQMPNEPRRLLPVLELPMTSHIGCCGCTYCPVSLYPQVTRMIMFAQQLAGSRPLSGK